MNKTKKLRWQSLNKKRYFYKILIAKKVHKERGGSGPTLWFSTCIYFFNWATAQVCSLNKLFLKMFHYVLKRLFLKYENQCSTLSILQCTSLQSVLCFFARSILKSSIKKYIYWVSTSGQALWILTVNKTIKLTIYCKMRGKLTKN